MRKEISKIINDLSLHPDYEYGLSASSIKETVDKILSLFEKKIDSAKIDIEKQFRTETFYGLMQTSPDKLAQDIINIIKSKVKK